MFRVRWCRLAVSALCFFHFGLLIHSVIAECWYNDELHTEGTEVLTNEPCLNCTCTKGALRCYLQVCPLLPNPPPPGCILLHRFQTCCQELVCTDSVFKNDNFLERRSEPEDESNILDERAPVDTACVVNGSIYGPGSAMDSSSFCEYCYCLGGKQVCVKPNCLLTTENCVPIYKPSNCCPEHYQCNYTLTAMSTTTTMKSREGEKSTGGCIVDAVYYKEGDKVLSMGHSECDNCYCFQGIVRCEPLSCAPPLFGCSPVIRPGECCAVSYNCSGVIEIKPEPNYGEFPTVSKDYAKLHREVQQKLIIEKNTENPSILVYNSADLRTTKVQRNTNSFATTRYLPYLSLKASTLEPPFKQKDDDETDIHFDKDTEEQADDNETIFISLLDDRLNRKIEAQDNNTLEEATSTVQDETTATYYVETADTSVTEEVSTESTTETSTDSTDITSYVVTVQTVLNSTDCSSTDLLPQISDEINATQHSIVNENQAKNLSETDDMIEMKNNKGVDTILDEDDTNSTKDIIFNMSTNKNQDYEYDYNEPTLPPSLPNLRIIPFVAADALDSQNTEASIIYSSRERVTDSSSYNLFSPPIETEGGFIPKQPPMLKSFYENSITSSTAIPQMHESNCINGNEEVTHGDIFLSKSLCDTCRCLHGNVVCQKIDCPRPNASCRRLKKEKFDCCPRYSCDDELTLVHHLNSTYKDPQRKSGNADGTILSEATTPSKNSSANDSSSSSNGNDFSLDKVLNLLFFSQNNDTLEEATTIRPKYSSTSSIDVTSNVQRTSTTAFIPQNKETISSKPETNTVDVNSIAILKLAGCNIYGRMYRVGRIISELSNPCLECKCTEIGVQCRALNC